MFKWLSNKMRENQQIWLPASQPPKLAFPFPVGTVLEAQEEVVLMIPKKVIEENEKIGEIILCPDNAEIALREDWDAWLVKLQKGFRLSITRSCQMMIIADDDRPRKVKIKKPE